MEQDRQQVVRAAVAAARHARETIKPPPKRPGTVTSSGMVRLDGDGDAIPVSTALVDPVVGRRVLVEFRPAGAAYIVATI